MSPTPEEILRTAGIEVTIPAMSAVVRNDKADLQLRYWAAIALGRTGDKQILPVLAAALNTHHSDLRYGAVVGMKELAAPDSVMYLRTALKDKDEGVRSVAVQALGRIGTEEAMIALSGKIQDRSEPVADIRMNAAVQLGRLKNPAASRALIAALKDEVIQVRVAAAAALADLGDTAGVSVLTMAVLAPQTEEWLRVDAIQALEKLTGQKFGYVKPYNAPTTAEERAVALQKIQQWWQANQANYAQP
jgi:HEAT repeat protein